jgi:hypothetical protein
VNPIKAVPLKVIAHQNQVRVRTPPLNRVRDRSPDPNRNLFLNRDLRLREDVVRRHLREEDVPEVVQLDEALAVVHEVQEVMAATGRLQGVVFMPVRHVVGTPDTRIDSVRLRVVADLHYLRVEDPVPRVDAVLSHYHQ